VHYVSPTDDNLKQSERMKDLRIYKRVNTEIGQIIVADVNSDHINVLVDIDGAELNKLITKSK